MKRRLFGLVMVATLSLAGCGSSEGTTDATTQQENVSQEDVTTQEGTTVQEDTTSKEETTVSKEESKTYEIEIE